MGGWGSSPWGGSPWGTGVYSASIHVASAVAVSVKCVRVALTAEPAHVSAFAIGDALNTATWTVTLGAKTYTVISIAPTGSVLEWDIFVLEPFAGYPSVHRVRSVTLRGVSGALISIPDYADFYGVAIAAGVPTQATLRDIKNPQVPNSPVGGTLEITSAGDYASVSGDALVRKLIHRRLTTSPGEFFHLPQYGLLPQLKSTPTASDLVRLKAEVERQTRNESEVVAAQADVSLTAQGQLRISVHARIKSDHGTVAATVGPVIL